MKPGIYKKANGSCDFMTVFPDMTGWNWSKFKDGVEDLSSLGGWKFINSGGDWAFRGGVHDRSVEVYVSPFELVRW